MKSRTKWIVVPSALFILSFTLYVQLLGTLWAILFVPMWVVSFMLLVHGLIEKLKIHKTITAWLDKDD